MLVKTLICDDNEKARHILKEYIKIVSPNELEVTGEAQNGYDLIELCKKLCPDLILLDIDMPFMNGIETAKKIIEFLPDVFFIFVTAYPSFSLEAFSVHPADFILKPFSIDRLKKSINYVIKHISMKQNSRDNNFLNVFVDHELYPIKQSDILFIERVQRKTVIHTFNKSFEIFESLDNLQEKIDQEFFFRVHNSYIVNANSITRIIKHSSGSNEIFFNGYKEKAYASRRNVVKLQKMLNLVVR